MTKRSKLWLCLAVVQLGTALATRAETAPVGGIEALQPVVQPVQTLYGTNSAVPIRFLLLNPTAIPIDVPLSGPPEDVSGVGLPFSRLSGVEAQLFVAFNDEKPVPVTLSQATPEPPGAEHVVRLAPTALLGTELDLREALRSVRYPGFYRVEWRPFGQRGRTATAEFRIEARKTAILVTDAGKINFRLFYDEAPRNVESFLELVRAGFYNGRSFHRIIPGFLIQGGCPRGDGTGIRPDGRLLPAEFHKHAFQLGTLAMARKPSDLNSASCQFFITLGRAETLDGSYSVIGQADDEESVRTLQALAAIPTDVRDRPTRPAVIRSLNLVDASDVPTGGATNSSLPTISPSTQPAPSLSATLPPAAATAVATPAATTPAGPSPTAAATTATAHRAPVPAESVQVVTPRDISPRP